MMLPFAVVDIETTGLFHQGHAITELAVVHVDDAGVRLAFHSVINPSRNIPYAVERLTGIDTALVSSAPSFAAKAAELQAALADRIFVAHQVNFDYTFVKQALAQCGINYQAKRLCTVRLSKRAIPELKSARLGAVCKHLGIRNLNPHRAVGDAMATAEVLLALHNINDGLHLEAELGRQGRGGVLPAQLRAEDVEALPESPGVYHFYGNDTQRPLYIGKAVNLHRRVLSHFTAQGGSIRKQRFQKEVRAVKYFRSGSAYLAALHEDADIRHLQPTYNIAQRERSTPLTMRLYESRSGYWKYGLVRSCGHPDEVGRFGSPLEAREWLAEQCRCYGFSPNRVGLPLCSSAQADDPNAESEAFYTFVEASKKGSDTLWALCTINDDTSERGFALVQGQKYLGFGTMPLSNDLNEQSFMQQLRTAPDTATVRATLRTMSNDRSVEKISLR